jgi:fibronectin-binding autotransporter adhesin
VQGADEQVFDTAMIALAGDGFWNLGSGNRSEAIGALTMTAGSIATGGGTLTVNGNVITNANAAGASIGGQLSLGGATPSFDIADGTAAIDLDISATISNGAGGLTKTGGGMMRLGGASAFSGPVTVDAGTLIIDGNGTIGALAGAGSVVLGGGIMLNVGGGSSTTFAGSISGAGGLSKSGAGMLTLSSAPTYTGNTLITSGTLALGGGIASAAGSLTVNAPGTLQARTTVNRAITGDGTILATGTLTIGDASSVSGFAFDGTLAVGTNLVALADADAAHLGVTTTLGNNGRLDTLNGAILASGRTITAATFASAAISGNLTNNATVNGPTTAGQSLNLLGDINGVGNYTGNVRFSSQLSPGLSAAPVSLENFQFDPTATLRIELGGVNAGAQFDQLNFTGTGLLGGTLSVSLINGFNPQPGNGFTFMQGGTLSGVFATMNLPPLDPGYSWSYAQTANTARLAVIPEPSAFAFVLSIAMGRSARRRRTPHT